MGFERFIGNCGRSEGILRICAILFLISSASLMAFDNQTVEIFHIKKKATYTSLKIHSMMVYVDSGAAVYNMIQLCKCWIIAFRPKGSMMKKGLSIYISWLSLFLDQVAMYTIFGVNSAGVSGSAMAITGSHNFQWMKLCNRYTRFCIQVGASAVFSYLAFTFMFFISALSAFNLFSNYSPNHFLLLKQDS